WHAYETDRRTPLTRTIPRSGPLLPLGRSQEYSCPGVAAYIFPATLPRLRWTALWLDCTTRSNRPHRNGGSVSRLRCLRRLACIVPSRVRSPVVLHVRVQSGCPRAPEQESADLSDPIPNERRRVSHHTRGRSS